MTHGVALAHDYATQRGGAERVALLLAAGVALYIRGRSRRHPVRPVRLAVVVLLLVGVYAASLLGPPPPSVMAIGLGDIGFLLFMGLAGAWADRPASAAELAAHPAR